MEGKGGEVLAINWSKALDQVGDDEVFLMEVLKDFFNETDDSISELRSAIDTTDFELVKRVVHRVKGSSAYVHCVEMNEIANNFYDTYCDESKSTSVDPKMWRLVENLRANLVDALSRLRREVRSRK